MYEYSSSDVNPMSRDTRICLWYEYVPNVYNYKYK